MSPQSHFEEANSGSNVIEVAERTAIPVPISDSPELSPKKLTSPERITHQNVEVIDVDEMSAEVANGSKKSFLLKVNVRFENLGSLLRFGFPEAGGIESGDLTVESIACLAAKVDDVLMSAWNEPRARRSVGRLSRVAEASHAREEEDDIEVTSMTRRPDSFSSSPAPRQYATRSAKALETKFIELSMTPKRSRDNTCLDATPL
ncbi:hypothetical protein BC829DRAFT_447318 [Chytridium lagenaria]|nr:hypothetical protein BC829DRAFT_447318 [Chytridium lagenaria]